MIKINGFLSLLERRKMILKIALKRSLISLLKLMIMDLWQSHDGVRSVITIFAVFN